MSLVVTKKRALFHFMFYRIKTGIRILDSVVSLVESIPLKKIYLKIKS